MYSGKLVELRPFEEADLEAYRAWVNDAEIARLVDRVAAVTAGEHKLWYQQLIASDRHFVFAIDRRRKPAFVGLAWLYDIHWRHRRAEVRIVIGNKQVWGKGLGTDALRVLQGIAFDGLDLEKLWADVLETNPRAVAAFEQAGFVREGLLRGDRFVGGARTDVVRLGLCRNETGPTAR